MNFTIIFLVFGQLKFKNHYVNIHKFMKYNIFKKYRDMTIILYIYCLRQNDHDNPRMFTTPYVHDGIS